MSYVCTVKRSLAIVLGLLVLLQTVHMGSVILGYELNKDFISNTLCINREKPEMLCNGKCYLMQELEKSTDSESDPANIQDIQPPVLQCEEVGLMVPSATAEHYAPITGFVSTRYAFDWNGAIFHPPRFAA